MGYYTYFEIHADDDRENEYIEALKSISGYNHESGESIKWYEHEEDMRQLSLKHPDVTFRLDGNGEGHGDIWVKWFKAGDMRVWRWP